MKNANSSATCPKLNPFGIILESLRTEMTPDLILATSSELSPQYLHPGPALGVAAEKIKPFVRDVDVSALLDGTATVEQFNEASGLDVLMGTVMVLTLVRARLASLNDAPRSMDESVVTTTKSLHAEWDDIPFASVDVPLADGEAAEEVVPGPSLTDSNPF